ncbi:MAG: PAS domain S-box protein [Chitinophagaceae bacterium]
MPKGSTTSSSSDITRIQDIEGQIGKLAAIVQSSVDVIISKTLEGVITSWNPAAEKLFGYTSDEVIGQHITIIIPEDRIMEEPRILEQLKKGESVEHFETKRITKKGEIVDLSLTISPIRNDSGQIIGVSKIARDITEQKKLHEALRESEERLRMAGESMNMGTWDFQPLTKKILWSDECRKIYGLKKERLLDSQMVIDLNHPDDKECIAAAVAKALDPAYDGNFKIEHRIIRDNDKRVRWVRVQGKVFFKDHQPERFIGTMLDITEEKLAVQLIRESEERLRMAIQSTQLGTWEFNPQTGKLNWSDECRKIYDVPANVEIDYDFFSQHIFHDDKEIAEAAIREAMNPSGNGDYHVVYRILRYSDKQPRWIRTHGKVFFDPNNQAERFIGTVLDITAEKEAEQELKDSVELFKTMADNVPAMIWMSGDDKFNDYFNKTWLEFTGRTLEQERNDGWLERVHPDDTKHCQHIYDIALQQKRGFYIEYRLKRYDGQYRWISDNCVPRFSPKGEFTGFISACIDIDDQKRFREKILDSELLFKTISNAAPVGLWMTDTEGKNTFVNETWIKWTGSDPDDPDHDWLERVLEEDKATTPQKFREAMVKKKKFTDEFRIVRKDGELRWCLTEGYPYYDITGEFAGYAGSVTDITEIRKLEQRKDDFIKMASHELKTPITSIKGYVQLLLSIYDEMNEEKLQASKATVKSSLGTISKQVNKLTRLISELLDLNRIESGKLELYKTSFDPVVLVEETVQDIRQTTSRHALIVHNDFEGTVYADKDRISQVLLNLLTNAVKYSPGNEQIDVYVKGNDRDLMISVKDYGIGIDKKEHAKIFERFYRVEGKNELTYPGFGIGLFIAAEIIQRHDGTIKVESEKDRGAIFSFTLPLPDKNDKQ